MHHQPPERSAGLPPTPARRHETVWWAGVLALVAAVAMTLVTVLVAE